MKYRFLSRRTQIGIGLVGLVILVGLFTVFRNGWTNSTSPLPTVGALPKLPGFRDVAKESGIKFQMRFLPGEQGEHFKINLYDHGCGLAVGDYDNDGHDDIYFLNQLGANALYRNNGDGTFRDVTEQLDIGLNDRICVGATFADYDNDGDQDLYVTSTRGGNVLFRNERGRSFVDVTTESGLTHVGHSQTAVFFDYDRDSLLDLYVVQTAEWTSDTYDRSLRYYLGKGDADGLAGVVRAPKEYNILYHNEGNGKFADVTQAAEMRGRGWSSDAAVFDYDEDGWLDVLVVCMFGRAQLYHNQHDGTFKDVTLDVLGRTPFGGIGAQVFDFDNDGRLDVYIVDMHSDMWMGLDESHASYSAALKAEKIKFDHSYGPQIEGSPEIQEREQQLAALLDFRHDEVIFGNGFYRSLGNGKFEEISEQTNLETFWPWGVACGDFDNNGFVDAFIPSGMGYPFFYWPNQLLMNGGRGVFSDRAVELGIEPPRGGRFQEEMIRGRQCARSSRCAVAADFNSDGRLELVTNNFNDAPYYFKSELPRNNFIAFQLVGTKSNRDAIGALVRIKSGDRVMVRQVPAAGGYLSHASKKLHFGLGTQTKIDRAEVLWPSGAQQVIASPTINKLHEIEEPEIIQSDNSQPSNRAPTEQ